MTNNEVKQMVEDWEYYANGLHTFNCGGYPKATNVKVRKQSNKVIADVAIRFDDHEEKYFDCEYRLSDLLTMQK